MNNYTMIKIYQIFIAILTLTLFFSCKENDPNANLSHDDIELNVRVLGIENNTPNLNKKSTTGTLNSEQDFYSQFTKRVHIGDFEFLAGGVEEVNGSFPKSRKLATINKQIEGSTPLEAIPNGVKYRFLLYDVEKFAETNNLHASAVYTAGVSNSTETPDRNEKIIIKQNKEYKYVVFSLGTTIPNELYQSSSIHITSENNYNDLRLRSGYTHDLMVAQGSIKITDASNRHLDIIFKRLKSKVGVKVKTKGTFRKLYQTTDASKQTEVIFNILNRSIIKNDGYKPAQVSGMDVNTGLITSYNSNQAVSPTFNLSVKNFDTDPDTYDDEMEHFFYFYTTDRTSGFEYKATIQSLYMTIDNAELAARNLSDTHPYQKDLYYSYPAFGTTINQTPNPTQTYTIIPAMQARNAYYGTMELLGMSTSVKNGGNTLRIAEGDLYYDASATNETDKYKFHTSTFATDQLNGNQYWPFGALTPTGSPNYSSPQDPCKLVYPAGYWQVPTANELDILLASNPTNYTIFNRNYSNYILGTALNTSTHGWFDYTTLNGDGTLNSAPFPLAGYIKGTNTGIGTIVVRTNADFAKLGSTAGSNRDRGVARYWSSTITSGWAANLEIHPTHTTSKANPYTANPAHALVVRDGGRLDGDNTTASTTSDVRVGGTNKHVNDRYRIRCVRVDPDITIDW